MRWLETTKNNNRLASVSFWEKLKQDVESGSFWADKIKDLYSEPAERLALAMENLPLPGAFKEATIAARALIRQKRKAKDLYLEELELLYWLAAIESFSIPYSKYLKQPGFNVMQSVPGDEIIKMDVHYSKLGYEKLNLLNKTDAKWLVEVWGKPKSHTTMHKLYKSIWQKYEKELPSKQEKNLNEKLTSLGY